MKSYIKPNTVIFKQMGANIMLDTSGGGGQIVNPPQSKDTEFNGVVSHRSVWDGDEEE